MTPTPVQRVCQRFRSAVTEDENSDAGFTLVEVMVSFAVLLIVSLSAVAAIVSLTGVAGDARQRVAAANVAQQDLAQQRAITDRTKVAATPVVNGQYVPQTRVVGSATFSLTRKVSGTCTGAHDKNYTPVSIDVWDTVTWPGSKSPVVVGTRLAC